MRTELLAFVSLALLSMPAAAFGHGGEEVGTTSLVIGWAEEPAYAGFPNAVEVIVEHDGRPRDDAQLRVTVLYGEKDSDNASDELVLEKAFGEPGTYHAPMIPSEAGTYTFRVRGQVAEDTIDVTMTSGGKTFNGVQPPADVQFPASDTGTVADVAERLDTQTATLQAAATDAKDAAEGARLVALIALGVAALSAVFGFVAMSKAAKR